MSLCWSIVTCYWGGHPSFLYDDLCNSVSHFKASFLQTMDEGYQALEQEMQSWRDAFNQRIQQKFARIEEVLQGPYNRELTWDWVEDGREFEDIPSLVEGRKVRLREDPSLEMTGREYFDRYAKGGLGLLRMLDAAGYFTPPNSKFFLPFCKCLLEGTKTLLRKEEVVKVSVPADQVDLAFYKAQELIATDAGLQKFCPAGVPMNRDDKEFYLHVVNTIYRSIPYKVVFPLTESEQRSAGQIRDLTLEADKALIQAEPLAADVRSLTQLLENSKDELITTDLLDLLATEQAQLVSMEQAEEMEVA